MLRTIAIWVFGLLASAIVGGFIGYQMGGGEVFWAILLGALGGLFAFACARLIFAAR